MSDTPRPGQAARPLHTGGYSPAAHAAVGAFHSAVVREVADAVARDPIVVVGMATNPFVGKARKALSAAGHSFTDLRYGGYTSAWKQRLAIKMWSGWPTFPQVFVQGQLLGGFTELEAALASGELKRMLDTPRS